MSVDMHEYKFILELEKLKPFEPGAPIDPQIRRIGFPAWRAVFSSMILWGHSTGYRLLGFDDFFLWCKKAYTNRRHGNHFTQWFDPPEVENLKQRIKFWYESGMAETYLYACLVDAFEDALKEGIVLYDPRLDWKQKWDASVVIGSNKFYINAMWGSEQDRESVEEHRDAVERQRKKHTSSSAHWGNKERENWTVLNISRSDADCQIVNGVRLFSIPSINALLAEICAQANTPHVFQFAEDREGRKRFYYSLIDSKKRR